MKFFKAILLAVVLTVIGCIASCTPPLPPTERESRASLVVLHEAYDLGTDVSYPKCGAVAVSEHTALTVAHCLTGPRLCPENGIKVEDDPLVVGDLVRLVTRYQFQRETDSFFTARITATDRVRDFAVLKTKRTLEFVPTAHARDGAALLVRWYAPTWARIRGHAIQTPIRKGDSGSGVFQDGAVVGLVRSCFSRDGQCSEAGGEFVEVLP